MASQFWGKESLPVAFLKHFSIGTTLSKVKKVKKYLNFRAKKIITIEFLISQIFIILFIKIRQNLNMLNEI